MTKYQPEIIIINPAINNKLKNKNSHRKTNHRNIKIFLKISANRNNKVQEHSHKKIKKNH